MTVLRESPWYREIEDNGIQLGKQEGIRQVARNLLATGMAPAQIAAVTGLTLEQIGQLQT